MAQQSMAKAAWASGGMMFAATMLLIIGIFQIFEGIAAIARNQFFVIDRSGYYYNIDTTAWGWIHLGIGVLAALTGLWLFTGATWARVIGIGLAAISAIANFFFIPYYPVWSLLIIALDVFVIWALATAPSAARMREQADAQMMAGSYAGGGTQAGDRWSSTNVTAGRHWAGEPAKETGARAEGQTQGTQGQMSEAEAMAQRGGQQQPPTMPNPPGN